MPSPWPRTACSATVRKLATDRIAVLSFVYPAVAVLVDLTVYGHRIDALQSLGVVLIAAAALAVNLGRLPLPPGGRRRTAGVPGPPTAPPMAGAVRR